MRVRLLGGLAVDGVAERELGSRKARTLLKLLALARGAPVTVDRIADVLWGDSPPARPADQVGVLVSRLRGVLGTARLPRTDAGYSLAADWLDVDEVAALGASAADALAAGRVGAARAAVEAALALARGPLLPGDEGEWVEAERAAAAAAVARARAVGIDAAVAACDHGAAVVLAEQALAHDPYDEAVLRALMRAHLAAGRPASALAAYARLRERLAEDLGVPPTAETEAVHDAALAAADGNEAQAAATTGGPLGSAPPIVGRDAELAQLADVLAAAAAPDASAAAVTVRGPAGIGKSALVAVWADAAATGGEATVLVGRCDPLGRDLPLQPLADALAAHLRAAGGDTAERVLADDAAALAGLLGLGTGSPEDPAPLVIDTDAGRNRLFQALLGAVQRAAGDRTAVVVVEDLQWAGPSTLAWLAFALRRGRRLVLVGTCRPESEVVPGSRVLDVGPLGLDDAAALVGADRAAVLHARSGGNPLFLTALAAAPAGDLPLSVRAAVDEAAAGLGPDGEAAVRAAAVLGEDVDVELLAAVLAAPTLAVLDHLEAGVRAGLLVERAAGFASRHALVREVLEAGVSGARRALLHRQAAAVLAARPRVDSLAVAVHARQGGDAVLAAAAFAEAATGALARFDAEAAIAHADAAVELDPTPAALVARARVRLALQDLAAAADDAERAAGAGGGATALEVAGWVAYARRRYDEARRLAEEAAAQAPDLVVRASCAALAGRVRHGAGDLPGAAALLEEAATGSPQRRAVAAVWLAGARVHQGRPGDALAALDGVPLDAAAAHASVPLHGRFARALALADAGRPAEALATAEELAALAAHAGPFGTRFVGVAANVRAWVLRWTGRAEEADEELARGLATTAAPDGRWPLADWMSEPFWVAQLDLADGLLLAGDSDGAAALVERLDPIDTWNGTMAWHQRHRLQLLRARLALLDGDADRAAELAAGVVDDAAARGARRYELLAAALAGVAARAPAGDGEAALDEVVAGLGTCAGLDGWWSVAELAGATGVDRWRAEAERRAAAVVAAAPAATRARAGRFADDVLARAARTAGGLSRRRPRPSRR